MAIESAVCFRRLVRTGLSGLLGVLALCGVSAAQQPVSVGSVIPLTHSLNWGQIYRVVVAHNGSVVLLDTSNSGLYQLSPGTTTFTTIASGPPLEAAGTYWNEGMVLDAKDTMYLSDRYGTNHFYRIPYNPKDGTWDFTPNNAYGGTIDNGLNTLDLAFTDSAARDGSGTLFVSTETSPSIIAIPVDNQGNPGTAVTLVKGLEARAAKIASDVNGNVYFVEDPFTTTRAPGVYFIPKGTSGIAGAGDGSAEKQLQRLDPVGYGNKFNGITLDAAGNLYFTSQVDTDGGTLNGELMIPNTSGSPVGVSATSFNFSQATYIAPVVSGAALAIDPRGFLWIPTAQGGWTPNGSTVYPGTLNVVLWALGTANLGATPVGAVGPTGTVFFDFNAPVTPGSLVYSQPGKTAPFVTQTVNPIADPKATTVQTACTPGKVYQAETTCPYWIAPNPALPGAVSSQLTMLDANNQLIAGSTTYLNAIGQGPAVSLLSPAAQSALATGLVKPAQVAADTLGNSYLADPGQGKVLEFAVGSASAAAGTSIGTGLTAPTGVAVDGSGDVYIADSGKVYAIPLVNGALNASGQTTIATGLGANLQLAADGAGNVFVADPANARVVKINNAQTSTYLEGLQTVGTGFTAPSAVATDNSGNLYVADGTNLIEVTYLNGQTTITSSLSAPVTGLAVDPSGSVVVSQTGGIIRIPSVAGSLSFNAATAVGQGSVTAPNSVALDAIGDLYVSDSSNGKQNLLQLGISGAVNFGQVSPGSTSNPVDIDVFDIGNTPLALTAVPTLGGANAGDFGLTAAAQTPCDTTGATTVATGADCIVDVVITPSNTGVETGTIAIPTNAGNAATVNATMTATAVGNLEKSATSLVLTPATGVNYPGSTSIAVTVAPTVSQTVPTGSVIVTLTNQNPKTPQTITLPTGTLSSGQVSFQASKILGGTYTVKASYRGDANFSGSSATTTLTVAQATPTVTLSEPANVTPLNSVYYVKLGSNTALTAQITSSAGAPTGSIAFMNGATLADPKQAATTLNATGSATFSTQNLPAGNYKLTAVYSGDQNFATVTSAVISFQVLPASVIITASPATLSGPGGTALQSTLTLTSLVGYATATSNNVYMSIGCVGPTLPKYTECTFTNQEVQIAANGTATTNLTISTNLPVSVGAIPTGTSPYTLASVFGLAFFGLFVRRKMRRLRLSATLASLALMLAATVFSVTGCTNSSYSKPPVAPHVVTPSGTYNVSITAIESDTFQQVSLPFTINVTVQ